MNKFPSMLAVGLLIGASTGVAATSASDAQRYCEDIQQGQQKAQEEYVKIYTPEVNPTEVFQNSSRRDPSPAWRSSSHWTIRNALLLLI